MGIRVQTSENKPPRPPLWNQPQGPKYAYLGDDDSSSIEGMIREHGTKMEVGEKDFSVTGSSIAPSDVAPSVSSMASTVMSHATQAPAKYEDVMKRKQLQSQPGFNDVQRVRKVQKVK